MMVIYHIEILSIMEISGLSIYHHFIWIRKTEFE